LRSISEGLRCHHFRNARALLAIALALSGCAPDQLSKTILPREGGVAIEPVKAPTKIIGDTGMGIPTEPAKSVKNRPIAAEPSTALTILPPHSTPPAPDAGRVVLIPPPGAVPVIKVALLIPMSGSHAKLGQSLLNASQMALFDIAGEGLALLPMDTQGTAEGAAVAALQAVEDGARLILGPVFSTSVAAVAPIARSRGIQVVSFSNNRAVAGNGVYVMGFSPETQIRRVMTYVRDRGLKRLAALVPEGPYGDRVAQTLQTLIPVLSLELKAVTRYRGQATDALAPAVKRLANYDGRRKVLLARRKELKAESDEESKRALKRLEKRDTLGDVDFDAVFLPQGGASLRALAPLLRFYDVDPRKVRVLGTVDWNDPVLATEPALYGGWFTAPPPTARLGFETAYKKAFGRPAPPVASLAYDATALAAVIARSPNPVIGADPVTENVATVPSADRLILIPPRPRAPGKIFTGQALTTANGFAGADGIFRLLPSGLVERGFAVMEVRARSFVVVSPAPQTFQALGN